MKWNLCVCSLSWHCYIQFLIQFAQELAFNLKKKTGKPAKRTWSIYGKNINLEYLWSCRMQNNNFKSELFSYFYYFCPVIIMCVVDVNVMNTCTENCVLFSDHDWRSDLWAKKLFHVKDNLSVIYIFGEKHKLSLHPLQCTSAVSSYVFHRQPIQSLSFPHYSPERYIDITGFSVIYISGEKHKLLLHPLQCTSAISSYVFRRQPIHSLSFPHYSPERYIDITGFSVIYISGEKHKLLLHPLQFTSAISSYVFRRQPIHSLSFPHYSPERYIDITGFWLLSL